MAGAASLQRDRALALVADRDVQNNSEMGFARKVTAGQVADPLDWTRENQSNDQYVNRRPSNLEKYNNGTSKLVGLDELNTHFENHRPSA